MWESLQRYKALPPEARSLFRRAVVLLLLIRTMLRLAGYKRTQRWLQDRLGSRSTPNPRTTGSSSLLEMTSRMVRAAEYYSPGHATCLEESLALWYLLQKQNISAVVRIGVRKESNHLEAHAWVEQNGIALNQHGEQHRHYTPFESEQFSPPAAQS
jgi:Transglutaminase-like superfamily